jgi:4-amino-4-deoxy-L-arabinose transferase-like glycosyltransferase
MDRQTFAWDRAGNKIRRADCWIERLWVLGLFLAALLLLGINLGSPPLLEWGEGTVSLVARELQRASVGSWSWFYPTLSSQPYLEEPPLLYWLIATAYQIGGINEWTTRLPGAILSALAVPLLYGIGREIFPSRQSALFSSLIYLTLLPMVYYGRLATVDGTALCCVTLMMWCVLRSRRDLRWALGVGIGLGLICLTKGLLLGALLAAIALLFLGWDTPRLLTSTYWWFGLVLGIAPVGFWYAAGVLKYGQTFISTGITNQFLKHLWLSVTAYSSFPWYYYLVEILKFFPWLLFFPFGLRLAWENRNWGWAKLVLVWVSLCLLSIAMMITKLPWYTLPIYPALALAVGAQLTEVWHWPSHKSYPLVWSYILKLLAVGGIVSSVYFGLIATTERSLGVIFASVALTMTMAAILVARRDLQFILILFWGMYISLLIFTTSPYWMLPWKEGYPVKPIAAILQKGTLNTQPISTWFPDLGSAVTPP